jgi:hypothetical protein
VDNVFSHFCSLFGRKSLQSYTSDYEKANKTLARVASPIRWRNAPENKAANSLGVEIGGFLGHCKP